jgi:hypothetical protein
LVQSLLCIVISGYFVFVTFGHGSRAQKNPDHMFQAPGLFVEFGTDRFYFKKSISFCSSLEGFSPGIFHQKTTIR